MNYFLKRSAAYMIDCAICYGALMLIVQWAILSNVRDVIGLTDEWFHNSWNMEVYVLLSISIPTWIYFAFLDSVKSKGSFGKRLMKLAVLNDAGDRIGFGRSFGRTILKLAPWEIAHLGVIFPSPMYFEEAPDMRILPIVGMLLFVVFVVSILLNGRKQSVYDLILKIRVAD